LKCIGRFKLQVRCGVVGGGMRFGAHAGRKWAGYIVAAARLQLVREVITGRISAKRQTAGIKFIQTPKIRFFAPQGRLDRCTDSRQNWQG